MRSKSDKNVLPIVLDVAETVATLHKAELTVPSHVDRVQAIVGKYDQLPDESLESLSENERELLLVSHTTHDVLRECVNLLTRTRDMFRQDVDRHCPVCRNDYQIPAGKLITRILENRPIPLRCDYCQDLVVDILNGYKSVEAVSKEGGYQDAVRLTVDRTRARRSEERAPRGKYGDTNPSPKVSESAEHFVSTEA